MLWIFNLILSTTLFLSTLSSKVQIKSIQESWFEAVKQCNTTSSRIATLEDIDGVDKDTNPCKEDGLKPETLYWIGSYHKLSNIISVEGCYLVDLIDKDVNQGDGHSSLRHCYQECIKISNTTITFAYKNDTAGGPNCFCNLNAIKNLTNLSQCSLVGRPLWWRYKIHKNEFPTKNDSCQMISCENSMLQDTFLKDILCGQLYNGKTPDEDRRYVCTTNTDNRMSLSPRRFSFMLNASVERDSDQNSHLIAECKSITCSKDDTFRIMIKNCTSETLCSLCLNGSKTIPFNGSKQLENNSSHTTARKLSTESNIQAKKTYAPSVSKLVYDASTYVDTTFLVQITTKFEPESTETNIKSSETYISSVANSHVTNPGKENMIQRTSPKVLDQKVNVYSATGVLIGVLVTALLIVVIIVLLAVCRFKRRGPFRNKRYGDDSHITEFHSPNYHEKDIISNKKTHTVQNSIYDLHVASENKNENEFQLSDQDSNNIPNNEYAVVTKKKRMICSTRIQQQSQNAENSDEAENVYDRLNHNRPGSFNSSTKTNNIYDSSLGFRNESDSTYVIASQVHVVGKDGNCVYDHMLSKSH